MNFYSYQGQEPQPLPERIRLDDGRTFTSLNQLTDEELHSFGFIGPISSPKYDIKTQKLSWNGNEYEVVDLTDQELILIEIERKQKLLQSFNLNDFWNCFQQTEFFLRLRKQAGLQLHVNVLYSEFLNFCKTADEISQYLNKLFLIIDFTEQEIESLSKLSEAFQLNFVPNKENIENHEYDFEKNSIVNNANRPFESWTWNGTRWEAPIPYPTDGKPYVWNAKTNKWKKV